MPKGNFYKSLVLNFIARNIDATPPTQLYLALYQNNPGDADLGTEANYVGYSRMPVSFQAPNTAGNGYAVTSNTNQVTFGVVSNVINSSIAYAALRTGAAAGAPNDNLAYYSPLAATYNLQIGVQPVVPIGSLSVSEG